MHFFVHKVQRLGAEIHSGHWAADSLGSKVLRPFFSTPFLHHAGLRVITSRVRALTSGSQPAFSQAERQSTVEILARRPRCPAVIEPCKASNCYIIC